jgi:hypothetical protein
MSKTDYAKASGRESPAPAPPAPKAPQANTRPLAKLSEHEENLIARRRELVYEFMPELLPEIKQLSELGMIDGWRNVQRIEVLSTGEVA